MEGVEILNTIENSVDGGANVGIVLFSILTLICAILAAYYFIDEEIGQGIVSVFMGLVCFALVFVAVGCVKTPTRYKVTISDSVSFNEFNEHYKIIEQDGKIFTVEEKNEE